MYRWILAKKKSEKTSRYDQACGAAETGMHPPAWHGIAWHITCMAQVPIQRATTHATNHHMPH